MKTTIIMGVLLLLLTAGVVHAAPKNYTEEHVNVTGLQNALLQYRTQRATAVEQNLARWNARYGLNNYTNVTTTDVNLTASVIEAEKPYKVLFFSVTGTDEFTMNNGQATEVQQSLLARFSGKKIRLNQEVSVQ